MIFSHTFTLHLTIHTTFRLSWVDHLLRPDYSTLTWVPPGATSDDGVVNIILECFKWRVWDDLEGIIGLVVRTTLGG